MEIQDTILPPKKKKIILHALISVIILVFIILLLGLIMYITGKSKFEKRNQLAIPDSMSESDRFYFEDPAKIPFDTINKTSIEYQGSTYYKNPNLIVLYLMGIDSDHPVTETAVSEGGQSDANFMLFIDTLQKTIRIVSVNRNAMTDIDIYDTFGDYGYTIPGQLCLQHAYGNGLENSCIRSTAALSRLLYHMPINGYYALQKGAIASFNDAIGGVQLVALEDVIFPEPETIIHKGDTILLKGSNAYYYLTFRYVDNFGSNNGRLDRERQYINAFLDKFYSSCIRNPLILAKCYQTLKDYSVTDLSLSEQFYLLVLSQQYSIDTQIYNIPGETTLDGLYECYNISEEDMISFLLNYYYIKE